MMKLLRIMLLGVVLLLGGQTLLAQESVDDLAQKYMGAEAQYAAVESIVNFENEGQNIVGTMTMPEGFEGQPPIVLMFHGFTGNRQELPVTGTEETMFSRTARLLAEQGFASLRIDFRGSGESEGAWEDTTFSGQIADAIAAIDYVMTLDSVDSSKLALLGLSQGGLVASATSARDERVKSVVLWSAVANPPYTFATIVGAETIAAGLAGGDEPIPFTLPWGAESSLKSGFFQDLYQVDPIAEISQYEGPLMAIVGLTDTVVTPMPQAGELYLTYHPGENEKLVTLDAEHVFDILTEDGPKDLDIAVAWSLAWLATTL